MNKGLKFLLIVSCFATLVNCGKDNEEGSMESSVIGGTNFERKHIDLPINPTSVKLEKVQTNANKTFLLGEYNQGEFGKVNSEIISQLYLTDLTGNLGLKSPKEEIDDKFDEQEKLEEVYLYLPYYSTITKKATKESAPEYKIDSIFGDKSASFKVKIQEVERFLTNINKDLSSKVYYSDEDVPMGKVLGEEQVNVDLKGIKIVEKEEAKTKTTTKKDKKKDEAPKYLKPGIYVKLNPEVFKEKYFDKEGDETLKSRQDFSTVLKGISVSCSDFSKDFIAAIDVNDASIFLDYSYNRMVDNKVVRSYSRKTLTFGGVKFVKYKNSGENINDKNIYLRGTSGYSSEFTIDESMLKSIDLKKNMIADASLYFYVDKNKVGNSKIPDYLLGYAPDKGILLDSATGIKNGGGVSKLEKDDKGNMFYRIKITDHLIDIISKGEKSAKIGIIPSLSNGAGSFQPVKCNVNKNVLKGGVENPFGVILVKEGELRPVLKLRYIEVK